MNLRYAQDYTAGDVFDLGTYDVTQEEIIEFSRKYDPFPFHIDDQAACCPQVILWVRQGWRNAMSLRTSFVAQQRSTRLKTRVWVCSTISGWVVPAS